MATKKKTPAKNKKKNNFEFFKEMETGNDIADGKVSMDTAEYIDSGAYSYNASLSGDMTIGFASNKIYMGAGKQSVGKTFLAMYSFCRPLVELGYYIYYIDTEASLNEETLRSFGIPEEQSTILRQGVVEDLTFEVNKILNNIEEKRKRKGYEEGDLKCAFVLDSQGQLDTLKSRADTDAGKNTVDLTLQKFVKKFYKTVTVRMATLNIPMYVTNHIYENNMSFIPLTVVSGGQGGLYASSNITLFRKKQYKEGSLRKGTILTGKIFKSRMCQDGLECTIYLDFDKGLNKWYGIHEFAEKAGLIEKMSSSKASIAKLEKAGYKLPADFSDGGFILIKDPKITDETKWIICKESKIHKESVIGTIFDEINEWVKKTFKLINPVDFSYDDDDTNDADSDLEEAVQDIKEENVTELEEIE